MRTFTIAGVSSTNSRQRKKSLQQRRARVALWLVAPALTLLFAVAGWPLIRTILYSFTDAILSTPEHYDWVGFDNYYLVFEGNSYGVLTDPLWWQAVGNTLWFTGWSVSLELVFGLLFALLMNQKFRGRGFLRAAILVPWAIPTIVSAKMWGWMFHDQYGVVNSILNGLGITEEKLAWIAEPSLSMWAVVMADVWKTVPFMALMILAALQTVPADLYEAAKIDGANAWKRFWRITLPLIMPAILVATIFRMMDALRIFDLIYVLTSNSDSTVSISGYARDQLIEYQEMGMGSAASVLVFVLIASIAISFLYVSRIYKLGDDK
ncbi:sugar ABC transporter permease [Vibrio sp. SCSIO 43132]|uniref:carbohydrate ABC transporter permease n=1 Tax=Vibrio TaxID=662 RepID=UPI001CAA2C43|nr:MULTISPECIES: sugar ABC transporter permease [Vibrio]UAB73217.1 sugar ABC transporter permease [Vibrio sp. SCSIO 43132]BDU41004.1 sugar ABC transporter permease [Vibrio nigripulchritudo]BDU46744.1 sugar ABC transporter permease [Vibrio nigripulchritudo]